jgi:hypothetical protein
VEQNLHARQNCARRSLVDHVARHPHNQLGHGLRRLLCELNKIIDRENNKYNLSFSNKNLKIDRKFENTLPIADLDYANTKKYSDYSIEWSTNF